MADRISPEILADVEEPRDVSISPDGKQVIYSSSPFWIRKEENLKSALWIADVGVEHSARRLTYGDFNNYSAKFSPDGKYISFISDRAGLGKKAVLYLLPREGGGGEAWALTSEDNDMGIGGYAWRKDGKAIVFTSADEKSEERKAREKKYGDPMVYEEDVDYSRLRMVDVESKEVKTVFSADRHVLELAWNSEGTKIVFATSTNPSWESLLTKQTFHVVDIESGEVRQLCEFPRYAFDLSWYNDQIIWRGGTVETSLTTATAIRMIKADSDDGNMTHLSNYGWKNCVEAIKVRYGKLYVHVMEGLLDTIETIDAEAIFQIKKHVGSWDVHEASDGNRTLVFTLSETGTPTEVYSMVNGKQIQVSNSGRIITEKKIGTSQLCEYTHEDGTPIDGFYCVPTRLRSNFDERKPQPTVLVVRGGPYGRMTDTFDVIMHFTTFFMSLGYLVLVPNYRGGASHGHDYATAVDQDASQSHQDVIWLVKKGIEEGRIDGDRVAITGWSQGGFLTYLSVTRDDVFHFRAAVPGNGISDWSAMALTSDLPTFQASVSGASAWTMKSIDDVKSRKCSPIFSIDKVKTPVLIIHGEKDARTPLEQGVGFYRGMKAKKKDVKMVVYPGEGHAWPVPWMKKHYVHMMETIEKFLKKNME